MPGAAGSAQNGKGGEKGATTEPAFQERGMDTVMARPAPKLEAKITVQGYKTFRKKLEVFEKMCARKGRECSIDGAYLIFSAIQ